MVQNNQKDRQSFSKKQNHKRKAQEVKTYKKGLMKLGHPADCNSKKKQFRQKNRDNEIKKKEVLQTPNKKGNDCLVQIYCQYLNHHRKIRAKTQTRSNV